MTHTPRSFSLPNDPERRQALHTEVLAMIEKQAVEPSAPDSPGFYSILFVVPKASGGWRPVIDLSALNKYLKIPTFKMETSEVIRHSMPQNAWVTTIDLKDAYFHVPMRQEMMKYLRFCYQGKVWQFRALPFGLSTAPWIFSMCVRELEVLAHRKGIQINQYLDDWLIRHSSPEILLRQTQWVVDLCTKMGFKLNTKKSDLSPRQNFVFLGYQFRTTLTSVFPTEERVSKLFELSQKFMGLHPQPASLWLSLLGTLAATEKLFPMGRLHMRALQHDLQSQWSQATGNMHQLVTISPQ